MLRVIHSYDVKPGGDETSFVEWLDDQLDKVTRRFGCLERKTWVFVDGIRGNYESGKAERRPKYLNEAFWPDQEHVNRFREWLMSEEGSSFRRRWFNSVTNHTVLRYVEVPVARPVTDD